MFLITAQHTSDCSPTPNTQHPNNIRAKLRGLYSWTKARSETSHAVCGNFEWKLSLTLTLAHANNEILAGLRLFLSLAFSVQLNSIYWALSPRPLFSYSIAKAPSETTIERKIFIKSWFEMEIFSSWVFHYIIASAFLPFLHNEPSLSWRANMGWFEFIRWDWLNTNAECQLPQSHSPHGKELIITEHAEIGKESIMGWCDEAELQLLTQRWSFSPFVLYSSNPTAKKKNKNKQTEKARTLSIPFLNI